MEMNNGEDLATIQKRMARQEPDYTRPLLKIPPESRERMFGRLKFLYGEAVAKAYMPELEQVLKAYYAHRPLGMIAREKDFDPRARFTEEDEILISYGNLLRGKEHCPLTTLAKFCDTYLEGTIKYPAYLAFLALFLQ